MYHIKVHAVLVLMHLNQLPMPHVSIVNEGVKLSLRWWRHLTICEIISCVGCKCSLVRLMVSQLLQIVVYEFQIKNIVQQGYEYLLIAYDQEIRSASSSHPPRL